MTRTLAAALGALAGYLTTRAARRTAEVARWRARYEHEREAHEATMRVVEWYRNQEMART